MDLSFFYSLLQKIGHSLEFEINQYIFWCHSLSLSILFVFYDLLI